MRHVERQRVVRLLSPLPLHDVERGGEHYTERHIRREHRQELHERPVLREGKNDRRRPWSLALTLRSHTLAITFFARISSCDIRTRCTHANPRPFFWRPTLVALVSQTRLVWGDVLYYLGSVGEARGELCFSSSSGIPEIGLSWQFDSYPFPSDWWNFRWILSSVYFFTFGS